MTDSRWETASAGAVADDVARAGDGWERRDTHDGKDRSPLWMVRCSPDADNSIRLGYLRRGDGAHLSRERTATRLDEHEVLVHEGNWEWAEQAEDGLDIVATGLACGRLADGTSLYAALRDREGQGEHPIEARARMDTSF